MEKQKRSFGAMPSEIPVSAESVEAKSAVSEAIKNFISTPEDIVRNIGAAPKVTLKVLDFEMQPDEEDREAIMKNAREFVEQENKKYEGTYYGIPCKCDPVRFISEKSELSFKVPSYQMQCHAYNVVDPSRRNGIGVNSVCLVGGSTIHFKDHKYKTDDKFEVTYLKSDECRKKYRIITVEG